MHGSQLTLQSTFAPVSLSKVLIGMVWTWFLHSFYFYDSVQISLWNLPSEVVIDAREIRRKYLRGWFFLDLISTVPFDIAIQFFSVMLIDGGHSQQAEKSTMMFRYLRLVQIHWVKCNRFFKILSQINKRFPTVETFACKSNMALHASMGWNV